MVSIRAAAMETVPVVTVARSKVREEGESGMKLNELREHCEDDCLYGMILERKSRLELIEDIDRELQRAYQNGKDAPEDLKKRTAPLSGLLPEAYRRIERLEIKADDRDKGMDFLNSRIDDLQKSGGIGAEAWVELRRQVDQIEHSVISLQEWRNKVIKAMA